jgi:hypothetical protein
MPVTNVDVFLEIKLYHLFHQKDLLSFFIPLNIHLDMSFQNVDNINQVVDQRVIKKQL